MSTIKVFGHQSPDTDATCSAIVWAWFLKEHRGINATPYILGNPNNEAHFVLGHWGVSLPEILKEVSREDKVAIVDTNNADELFGNINDTEILSIIDHHKLTGGLKTDLPPEIVIQPYASTMTVMFNVMNIEPGDFPREIAGLMLSGILSDTLEFRGPTTTDEDRQLATELASTLGVNVTEYANKMFDAKSDLSSFTDVELVRLDSKIFDIKGESIRVSVLETTNPQEALDRRDGIIQAIDQVCSEDHLQHVIMFVIDILNQEATVFTHNDHVRTMTESAFNVKIDGDIHVLPGIVSRKKQILPGYTK